MRLAQVKQQRSSKRRLTVQLVMAKGGWKGSGQSAFSAKDRAQQVLDLDAMPAWGKVSSRVSI